MKVARGSDSIYILMFSAGCESPRRNRAAAEPRVRGGDSAEHGRRGKASVLIIEVQHEVQHQVQQEKRPCLLFPFVLA